MKIDTSAFLKVENVKQGDLLKIKSEGEKVESKFKNEDDSPRYQFNFKVELADGTEKVLSINKTSLKNLSIAYGDESTAWIDKLAKVNIGMMPTGKKFIVLEGVE
ncbi:MAG: hypothetical protein WC554_17060 [Clostridia bacterium]|jgi:molybdopterin-binding protein